MTFPQGPSGLLHSVILVREGKRDKLLSENCHYFTDPLDSEFKLTASKHKTKYLTSVACFAFNGNICKAEEVKINYFNLMVL